MSAIFLPEPEDSRHWAAEFARAFARVAGGHGRDPAAQRAFIIALEGGLGAGKSHLSRSMLRAWGVDGVVPSPTYSLLEEYPDACPPAAHMDWYRLGDALELEMLDWDGLKARCGVILVEWASRIPEMHDELDMVLTIIVPVADLASSKGEEPAAGRQLACRALSPRGNDLLMKIQPEFEDSRAGQ